MFIYHTWRGYEDGMNLTFPGSIDYLNMGRIGGHTGGCVQGRIHAQRKTGVCGRSKEKIVADGRKGGFTQGPIHAKNKTGVCGRAPEQMVKDSRKGGFATKERGKGIFASDYDRTKGPRIVGRLMKERGMGIFSLSKDQKRHISSASGRLNFQNGVGIHGLTLAQRAENARKGGSTTARNKVGLFAFSKEQLSQNARKARHVHWHVKRNIVNPQCSLCTQSQAIAVAA
jgi:hypothetical protein